MNRFNRIQEEYLDPDRYLWGKDYEQPRCKCGAFLPWEPDKTECCEVPMGEDESPDYATTCYRECKKCGNTMESDY